MGERGERERKREREGGGEKEREGEREVWHGGGGEIESYIDEFVLVIVS